MSCSSVGLLCCVGASLNRMVVSATDIAAYRSRFRSAIAAIGRGCRAGTTSRGYPDYKAATGLQSLRDWFWTGRTMRTLKVKSASENLVVVGFIDPSADRIAHVNGPRERPFGVSSQEPARAERHRPGGFEGSEWCASRRRRSPNPQRSFGREDIDDSDSTPVMPEEVRHEIPQN